ncbi:MAG: fumarate reductase subunit D [Desulfovibrionaceae bacterium]|nr:fumarate reductase subunit D [Desulfovibrionaceae bacterium]
MRENKRNLEPVFWSLFGAGGALGAICAPALILSLMLLTGLGLTQQDGLFYRFMGSAFGRFFLFVFVSMTAWSGLHRITHTLHDLKIHAISVQGLCYGVAASLTALSLIFLLAG